jgi:iron(III) transport system substrate-binding protein
MISSKQQKQEGTLEFYAPSTLTPQGAQAIGAAFNKKYGLNVKLQYSPSGNMTRDIGKVVGLGASGVPPEWDLMVVTDAHHATLWVKKMHQPFDYKSIGVDPKAVQYDNGSVSFANQFVLPAYNKQLVPANDVPKSWDDLLNPKWKGKLGVSSATHHMARLAAGPWGEEKNNELREGADETGLDSWPPRGDLQSVVARRDRRRGVLERQRDQIGKK